MDAGIEVTTLARRYEVGVRTGEFASVIFNDEVAAFLDLRIVSGKAKTQEDR